MEKASVYKEAEKQALIYKWLASERAGRDLGDFAMECWVRDHWWRFLRAKWVEHLQGTVYWNELDRNDFGLLKRVFLDKPELLDRILDMIKQGRENLDILCWARESSLPMADVIHILERLDINSRRLCCEFAKPA
jgi:hypothetical protein